MAIARIKMAILANCKDAVGRTLESVVFSTTKIALAQRKNRKRGRRMKININI